MLNTNGKLASLIGRYYAMDRDQRWERIKEAYDLLIHGKGEASDNFVSSLKSSYDEGVTDEFIKPLYKKDNLGKAITKIEAEDIVLFLNFRTDRGRELTQVLSQSSFPEYNMYPKKLKYLTL